MAAVLQGKPSTVLKDVDGSLTAAAMDKPTAPAAGPAIHIHYTQYGCKIHPPSNQLLACHSLHQTLSYLSLLPYSHLLVLSHHLALPPTIFWPTSTTTYLYSAAFDQCGPRTDL